MRLTAASLITRPVRGPVATVLAGSLLTALLVALTGPVATADPEASSPARERAEQALSQAQALLSPPTARPGPAPRASTTAGPPRGDATLALRELQLREGDLSRADQRRASDLLDRPSTPVLAENGVAVVHGNVDQVAVGYAAQVLATITQVHQTYVGAGYRAPLPDGSLGGDPRIDIYLADLAPSTAYGYCTSDQPLPRGSSARWAFCVLDNSYTGYPGGAPTQLLQVTAAHEYFHAVQYAYDSLEDGWFLEGTAAWAEDQVYDDVDDNLQYAPFSPLAGPRFSLDIFDPGGFRQYGAWFFFRWLSERFPTSQGGMPVIVRQFLEAADSTRGPGADKYSTQAVSHVLKQYRLPIDEAFARFADANRRPRAFYSEARANKYPTAPLAQKITLSPGRRAATGKQLAIDHLASATTRFVPQRLTSKRFMLRVQVDLADRRTSPAAVVSTYSRKGPVKTKLVTLDRRGNGAYRTPFSSRKVRAVEVTLVNASTRFTNCYQVAVTYSCYGKPVDEGLRARVRATVLR
ncbi:MAG: hypothetical protein LH468_10425 [Nocardioides sp.]|nr:hypothetical protein [Nocardioides sp.]